MAQGNPQTLTALFALTDENPDPVIVIGCPPPYDEDAGVGNTEFCATVINEFAAVVNDAYPFVLSITITLYFPA
jgi:hypothetical protein